MSRTYKAVQATNPGTLELVEKPITEPGFASESCWLWVNSRASVSIVV
jgi:hypothetical protein